MTFVIIFTYIAISYFEAIHLLKNNKKKEVTLYFIMMITSLVLSILLSIGVKVPSPAVFIEKIVTMVTG
ncbi:hypothetical protein [Clostridium ganghwense]|uniref:Uncharacterized protein n=1 Tax=Clostridium ganghwense TaxID=312089 RepID=A0ABT4CKP5_9CLOT|nr:hypothetical protein [Clostridium ganghwense]MCY6369058.1 hypothetical protein [Clostridium ganghwense]